MAEQFKRTYISVREFVSSWEKEIYEFNNLDLFIFNLINELASELEQHYFSRSQSNDYLYLQGEPIGTLAFNIGDSLQLFFEKNCFGSCNLNCPNKLDDRLEPDEYLSRQGLLTEFNPGSTPCQTKQQCLRSDLLNYVVVDSVFDFYNYEMGIILDENDKRLLHLAGFILDKIVLMIRGKGRDLLKNPEDNASEYFSDLLQNDDSDWEDVLNPEEDEFDDEEGEEWKQKSEGAGSIIDGFIENYVSNFGTSRSLLHISKFRDFISDFLEIDRIEDLQQEDLEEFFTVVLMHDLATESEMDLNKVIALFGRMMAFLEFNHNIHLKQSFEQLRRKTLGDVNRTLILSQAYQQSHPLVEHLLSSQKEDATLVEGFYEITNIENGMVAVEDIHLKTSFNPVSLNHLNTKDLKKGDVLHMQIVMKGLNWEMVYLDMIYPAKAKHYLY